MTFFQRFKTPFTEGPADDQARLQPRMRVVGEFLQERREDLGLDLDEIGAMLRIKPAYLAALEQGRTQDLPGPTYAIGFVRAYADFLGLDSEQVLARFKAEAAGVTARPDLALPVPLGERSLPGGALVLVALIIGLCGYGIWYYHSTEERSRPERVASVPASLQTAPASVVATPASPPGPDGDSNGGGQTPAQPSLFGAAASPPTASPGAPPTSAPPTSAPPTSVPPPPLGASSQAVSSSLSQPAATGGLAPGTLLTPIPRNSQQDLPAPTTPPSQQASAMPPQQQAAPQPQSISAPAASPSSASATPPPSSAQAVPPAGGRVTIKALNDCWIQVRAADQSIVFSRVLKSGETYTVPQRSGLSLRTGNAGALEIAVDGKTVPSIGGIGALRRDVGLDPTELAAGTAVHG